MILAVHIAGIRLGTVNTAAVDGRGGLGRKNFAVSAVHRRQITAGGVVEANDTAIIGYDTVYGTKCAAGGALVAANGCGTGGIHFLHPVNQVLCNGGERGIRRSAFLNFIAQ